MLLGILTACGSDTTGSNTQKEVLKVEDEAKKQEEDKIKAEANKPENVARDVIHKYFGNTNTYDKTDSIMELTFNKDNGVLFVKVYAKDNVSEKYIKWGMWDNIKSATKALKDNKEIKTISYAVVLPLQDQYGNSKNEVVMKADFGEGTRNKINWDNFNSKNTPNVAENYWEHPVVKRIVTD